MVAEECVDKCGVAQKAVAHTVCESPCGTQLQKHLRFQSYGFCLTVPTEAVEHAADEVERVLLRMCETQHITHVSHAPLRS